MAFDGVWREDGTEPLSDSLVSFSRGGLTSYKRQPLAGIPLGNILKFDWPGDLDPPGQGPTWYYAIIDASTWGIMGGDLTVLEYRMQLDGNSRRRDLTQAIHVDPARPNDVIGFRRIDPVTGATTSNYPAVSVIETTLLVIPSPPALFALLALGATRFPRRRHVARTP